MVIEEKTLMVDNDTNGDTTITSGDGCQQKIEKLNKKLQATADELEEISSLYAKSVKEGLEKAKKIKELEDKIEELEEELRKCKNKNQELEKQLEECRKQKEELEKQLKDCQTKREELEKQLKDCQNKNQELEKKLKDCQDKSSKSETNKKIWTGKVDSKIPIEIWSVATDSKGNVYVGTRKC